MLERSQSSNSHRVEVASPPTVADNSYGVVKQRMPASTRRPLAVWIWSTLLIADAVLVARSVSGEMSLSLPPSLALLSMCIVALASFAAWLAFRSGSPHQDISQPIGWLPLTISLVASALWFGTLATQASPLGVGLLLGVILFQCLAMLSMVTGDQRPVTSLLVTHTIVEQQRPIVEHTLGSLLKNAAKRPRPSENQLEMDGRGVHSTVFPQAVSSLEPFVPADDSLDDVEEVAEHDEGMTQWMSRRLTDDGELIEGWLRIEFPAGQREATAHVSFCPPLSGPPQIETEDLDGADLEIRVGTAFPFGARLTVRRSSTTMPPHSARIGFVAVVAADQKAA